MHFYLNIRSIEELGRMKNSISAGDLRCRCERGVQVRHDDRKVFAARIIDRHRPIEEMTGGYRRHTATA